MLSALSDVFFSLVWTANADEVSIWNQDAETTWAQWGKAKKNTVCHLEYIYDKENVSTILHKPFCVFLP